MLNFNSNKWRNYFYGSKSTHSTSGFFLRISIYSLFNPLKLKSMWINISTLTLTKTVPSNSTNPLTPLFRSLWEWERICWMRDFTLPDGGLPIRVVYQLHLKSCDGSALHLFPLFSLCSLVFLHNNFITK